MTFKRYSLSVDDETYEKIENIVNMTGSSRADVTRDLIKRGLASEWLDENVDSIAKIVREQMEIVMKPHIERLAKLSSKSGHMSATAAFLNVQALMDLVPTERRKDVRTMYESARKKAVAYMKTPVADWDQRGNDNDNKG